MQKSTAKAIIKELTSKDIATISGGRVISIDPNKLILPEPNRVISGS